MLQLDIEEQEFFDEAKNEFIHIEPQKLSFEHSLISLSKWESKWHKPFLKPGDKKTQEESIDYIRCMCINKNVNPIVFWSLKQDQIDKLEAYIADPMTGTTITNVTSRPSRQIMTSELFYYYMFSFNIPIECEKWHLNRLVTLIEVFSIKNSPGKKMSKADAMARNRQLNAARRKKYNSKG